MKLTIRIFAILALVLTFVISSALAALADVEATCEVSSDYSSCVYAWHESISHDGDHDELVVYGELYEDDEMVDWNLGTVWPPYNDYVGVGTSYGNYNPQVCYYALTQSSAEDYGYTPWYDFADDYL